MNASALFRFLLLSMALIALSSSNCYGSIMYVFVTIGGSNGTSTDISTYNSIVSSEAAPFVPEGDTLVSCALVSTATVNLNDNCAQVIGSGEVLNLFNDAEVADSFADLLAGPFMSQITQYDGGPARQYWTGSTGAGVASANPLGVPIGIGNDVTIGVTALATLDPLDTGLNLSSSFNNVLGLVTFVSETPEPSTAGTAAIGCIGILFGVWRARRRNA